MTTESSASGVTIRLVWISLGHTTILIWMLTTACCLVAGSELRQRLYLVFGLLVAMHTNQPSVWNSLPADLRHPDLSL